MNFLAHFFLAAKIDDSFIGHMLGDFVKGRAIDSYSHEIRAAILLHRKVDAFTDAHPVTRISRQRISLGRRRFAGVLIDVCYDHFLARHWRLFSDQALKDFTQRVYSELLACPAHLPERLRRILVPMASGDWLAAYQHLESVGKALDRIAGRLTRGAAFLGGIDEIRSNYYGLERDFLLFFPQLVDFTTTYHEQRSRNALQGNHM